MTPTSLCPYKAKVKFTWNSKDEAPVFQEAALLQDGSFRCDLAHRLKYFEYFFVSVCVEVSLTLSSLIFGVDIDFLSLIPSLTSTPSQVHLHTFFSVILTTFLYRRLSLTLTVKKLCHVRMPYRSHSITTALSSGNRVPMKVRGER